MAVIDEQFCGSQYLLSNFSVTFREKNRMEGNALYTINVTPTHFSSKSALLRVVGQCFLLRSTKKYPVNMASSIVELDGLIMCLPATKKTSKPFKLGLMLFVGCWTLRRD